MADEARGLSPFYRSGTLRGSAPQGVAPRLIRDLRKNKIPGDPPPSPQVWGNRAIQSPPDLGA